MKRETTNRIRFVLEELLPPIIRDSSPMRWLFRRFWGDLIGLLEDFRSRAHFVDNEEYDAIYAALPRVQEGTDNSEACIDRILESVNPGQTVDIGCGTGALLQRIVAQKGFDGFSYTGVDFRIDPATRETNTQITFHESVIESLPFANNSFDTVICTHVLEHILDIREAVAELRRICRGRIIIVVPCEREYSFTFNPHLHFFPYAHSFLRQMLPVPLNSTCELIGRDFFYTESVQA